MFKSCAQRFESYTSTLHQLFPSAPNHAENLFCILLHYSKHHTLYLGPPMTGETNGRLMAMLKAAGWQYLDKQPSYYLIWLDRSASKASYFLSFDSIYNTPLLPRPPPQPRITCIPKYKPFFRKLCLYSGTEVALNYVYWTFRYVAENGTWRTEMFNPTINARVALLDKLRKKCHRILAFSHAVCVLATDLWDLTRGLDTWS
jgi:hypothetical protein